MAVKSKFRLTTKKKPLMGSEGNLNSIRQGRAEGNLTFVATEVKTVILIEALYYNMLSIMPVQILSVDEFKH
jgi:hypothetical protein